MKRRPLDLTEYGISEDRYKELHHFCQQYWEKMAAADDMIVLRSSVPGRVLAKRGETKPDGTKMPDEWAIAPRGSGGPSNPVAATAERREALLNDCRLIESSAREADANLAQWILKFETSKDNVKEIQPPCGINQFRAARKKFYLILHLKKCS